MYYEDNKLRDRYLTAIDILLERYENEEEGGHSACPLCKIDDGVCLTCPWTVIDNRSCQEPPAYYFQTFRERIERLEGRKTALEAEREKTS